ncbi:putative manganese-dependent inorganic diphosphatase [Proteiniclasticum sp. BAD-10]|uniref:inorganic diphosphatase n=1 Tax=Proteiniclasticum sediminis TaxID=2804028 RepID=A0A941CLA4_9CLOT|nr:putative manganese-dependent inorganic diphosphatase [Proteiniclasticum sediminis]MBR0574730.1 putative manganese-dependent inorganic diphosphatase [Proteiniclasticum sediminis]
MKDTVYITGHRNPDSDSICAALGYAEFKNKTGNGDYIPVRLGDINRETQFILAYFGVEPPQYIENVRLQVSDLNIDKIAPISSDITLKMAWNIMRMNNVKSLPVVDENERLCGVVSVSNVTESYMDVWDNMILGKSKVTVNNILDTLTGQMINSVKDRRHFYGKIYSLSAAPEEIGVTLEEGDVVISGDRKEFLEVAVEKKVSLIIITGNGKMDEDLLAKAKENGITVINTPYDTYTTSRLITQAVPVKYVMSKEKIVYFSSDDYIGDIRGIMAETRYRSYPVVNDDSKVIGTISRFHLISGKKKKVILVDHNEKGQSVEGLNEAEITEIIDHHRVADVATTTPIFFRNEPVGSTSTIVANIFFENGIRPSKKTAGILAGAIISDTLLFKSPTSTNIDRIVLDRLAQIADIDVEDFALEMFRYGTSLAGKTPEEILKQDFKIFTYDNARIGVSQVYTMDAQSLKDLKAPILAAMEDMTAEHNFSLQLLIVTDIYKEGSELIVVGKHKDLVSKAFNVELTDNSVYIPGILSRKKQVIPPISAVITR